MSAENSANDFLNQISQSDQRDAACKDTASIFGSYYKALIQVHVPDELAQQLVRDMHSMWWVRILGRTTSSGEGQGGR